MTGTCPVCGGHVVNLVRVGAHRIVDLRQFEWWRRYEGKSRPRKGK